MIFTSSLDISDYLRPLFPNFKIVPVAAFGIAYSIYEDDSYKKVIAEVMYHYGGRAGAMFDYDYKLIRKIKFPSIK